MKVIVYSNKELNTLDKKRIAGIMSQSSCPNESLKNTFKHFAFMQGNNVIYFDDITIQNRHTATVIELEV